MSVVRVGQLPEPLEGPCRSMLSPSAGCEPLRGPCSKLPRPVACLCRQRALTEPMPIGIEVEHPVPHVHSQNSLAEATIKCLQLIAQALVMRTSLPVSA